MKSHTPELIFWICVSGIVYHYVVYPVVLFLLCILAQARSDLSYLFSRGERRSRMVGDQPRVALLVSAYNEEAVIAQKMANCLDLDYPSDRLEFLFGVDAAKDKTAEILSKVNHSQLRVFRYSQRRGKLAVLSDLSQETSAEILIFTDANTILDRSCIRKLVRHFSDHRVGAVSGEEVRVTPAKAPSAESLYWRYESAVKILESRLNCSLGGNGAVLALRRALFRPIPGSIVEDFQIPLAIRFEGFRVVYDPEAIAVEEIAPTFHAQFARRVRIGAGNYQTLFRHPAYLCPRSDLLTFTFISHRLLRWLAPLLLLGAFFANALLSTQPLFVSLLLLQTLFYSLAAIGFLQAKRGKASRICALPMHFCSMNLALLAGLCAYLTSRQSAVWTATPRQIALPSSAPFDVPESMNAAPILEHRPAA